MSSTPAIIVRSEPQTMADWIPRALLRPSPAAARLRCSRSSIIMNPEAACMQCAASWPAGTMVGAIQPQHGVGWQWHDKKLIVAWHVESRVISDSSGTGQEASLPPWSRSS
ncbi:hypothetical protein RRG08_004969 [Elysia crispata]|uniref:Uncharacterized protein n=1 Tax=Elysia crispata TaxID=231223 RepID=A0AAE0ZI95_9GAST|nr:hypothetical protein RRG08_004969 [Elysia crispata]